MQRQKRPAYIGDPGQHRRKPTGERSEPVKLMIQLPRCISEQVEILAIDHGMTPSEFIVKLLEDCYSIGEGDE